MKLLATTRSGNFPVKIYESRETKSYQAYGYTAKTEDGQELVICLDPDMSPDLYWETFWHEIAHAFEKGYGLEIPHEMTNLMGLGFAQILGKMQWKDRPASKLQAGLEMNKQLRRRNKKKKQWLKGGPHLILWSCRKFCLMRRY